MEFSLNMTFIQVLLLFLLVESAVAITKAYLPITCRQDSTSTIVESMEFTCPTMKFLVEPCVGLVTWQNMNTPILWGWIINGVRQGAVGILNESSGMAQFPWFGRGEHARVWISSTTRGNMTACIVPGNYTKLILFVVVIITGVGLVILATVITIVLRRRRSDYQVINDDSYTRIASSYGVGSMDNKE